MTTLALRRDARLAAHAAASSAPKQEKSLLSYLGTALSGATLILVLAIAVVTIVLPALVGGRALTVLTQSMEPGLPPGTLVVVTPTAPADVRIGEVLTYQIESGRPDVVSHRVVSKASNSDGTVSFITKGDNNDAVDPDPVREVQVVGTIWYSVPLLGWANTLVNGDMRAMIAPFAIGGLFLYAAVQFVLALRGRRTRRG